MQSQVYIQISGLMTNWREGESASEIDLPDIPLLE